MPISLRINWLNSESSMQLFNANYLDLKEVLYRDIYALQKEIQLLCQEYDENRVIIAIKEERLEKLAVKWQQLNINGEDKV